LLGKSVLDGDILSLNPAKLAQLLPERLRRPVVPEAVLLSRKPIRKIFTACCASARDAVVRKKIASRRMAILLFIFSPQFIASRDSRSLQKGKSEVLTDAYLITLSALTNTFGGTVRPICFAALRLTTNSNFIGCSTGRSAGVLPFRILST
jgi:hypothetical protein